MYFGRKVTTNAVLTQFLADYYMTSMTAYVVKLAFDNLRGNDFEDALQVAGVLSAEYTHFAIFDWALAKCYKDTSGLTFVIPK